MIKLAFFPVLLIAGCVVAAVYGAIHNQISFTVSPEFFFGDLFNRVGLPIALRNRAGASLVGAFCSWWMGLVIGPPILFVGLILPGWRAYLKHSLIAFGVVAGTAILVGLGALAAGSFFSMNPLDRAGLMHDFSYVGGGVGILTGIAYLMVVKLRLRRQCLARNDLTKPDFE